MHKFAVIGQPVHHSLSPFIHHYFAKNSGIELDYQPIEVNPSQTEEWVQHFFLQDGKGLNVTLPLKEIAFALADVSHRAAQQAKAANTLWSVEGKIHADNTDGAGLVKDLQRYLCLENARILILGAGGAARGIVGPLMATGCGRLCVSNRHSERAHKLQEDFPAIERIDWDKLGGGFDLLINATAASLQNAPLPLQPEAFSPVPFVYDLAYARHQPTAFLQQCQELGWQGVDGLGMLVEQAAESFQIWHGIRPPTEHLIPILRQ